MAKRLVCIDTDVCIDFLRKREPGFTLFTRSYEKFIPAIAAITAFELYLGHIKMRRKDRINDFIFQFTILPFNLDSAERSANIRASLEERGEAIGIPDILIAGICVSKNIPLLTLNIKHFSRVDGLKLIQPT
jgi:tRNA(fMet)-specific endonuclease VapC